MNAFFKLSSKSMMKTVFSLLLIVCFYLNSNCQSNNFYSRQWDAMNENVCVSVANSNIHYSNNRVPQVATSYSWDAYAWRGEKINAQILVWSKIDLKNIDIKLSDLTNSNGDKISTNQMKISPLKYVWTDGYYGNGCYPRNNAQLDSGLVADLIDTATIIPLKSKTVQPLWLSVKLPININSGIYTGNIVITAGKKVRLKVKIHVSEKVLPPPTDWKFELDLWQYPVCIATSHNVPLWSEKHFEIMKGYYKMLADAGQKNITMSIIEGGNQTKDVSPAMIKWIKKTDGSWSYDYTLFDKYVLFMMKCGINKRINCYSMVPWNLEFSYFDEKSGKDTLLALTPSTPEYKVFWQTMLRDFTQHLKEKKWFDITCIAMDERKLSDMLEVIKIAREVDSDWKIALAGSYHKELIKDVTDYSVFKAFTFDNEELAYRTKNGMSSTFYTSCEGEKPNMFTFSPPAEAAWIGWYAAAKGFTGYLRWAYNFWGINPTLDSRSKGRYPAGDYFQIYPGPRSSVRFEKLLEGIQDYEKIRILREKYSAKKNTDKIKPLNNILNGFEIELLDQKSADEMLTNARTILNNL